MYIHTYITHTHIYCDVAVPTRVHPTIIAGQGLSGRATRENTRAEPSFRRDECDRAIITIINSRLFLYFFYVSREPCCEEFDDEEKQRWRDRKSRLRPGN